MLFGETPDPQRQFETGILIVRIEEGVDLEVADVQVGDREQEDIAKDAAEAPEVLALEIGAVAVAIDLGRHDVLAGLQVRGDVELGRGSTALAVADLLSVHPEVEGGVDACEVQDDLSAVPIVGNLESAPIGADGLKSWGTCGGSGSPQA